MVLTRSPLRISLGGGGTDLPSYYRKHGGFLISAAIDKYVFVSVIRPFTPGIYLKYSRLENVQKIGDVQHPIIRECLALMNREPPQIEITTLADIPAGTGLGSSGQLHHRAAEGAVCLRKALPPPGRACAAGLPRGDRPAEGAHREAGPVHCRLRRDHLLHVLPG